MQRFLRPRLEELEDRCLLSTVFRQYQPFGSSPLEIVFGNITPGPGGNVWFSVANQTQVIKGGGGTLGFSTPTGNITTFTIPSGQGQPAGITNGPDGNL